MKRLLGLLLVMGMVGCGGKENAGNAVDPGIGADEQLVTESGGEKSDPSNPNVKVDEPPVQAVDASKLFERGGLAHEVKSGTPFTGVSVDKYENGQKRSEATHKDGKLEGLTTVWHENGQKKQELTFKDGKLEGLATKWHKNGKKSSEATFRDGKLVSGTLWDDEGNEIKRTEVGIAKRQNRPAASSDPGFTYTKPESWQAGRTSSIRRAAFKVSSGGQEVEIRVFKLPASGLLRNVSRWAEQIDGKPLTSEAQLAKVVSDLPVGNQVAKFVELVGTEKRVTLAAILPDRQDPQMAWRFVLSGPAGKWAAPV